MPNQLWRCAAVIASIALASTAEAQVWGSCGKAVVDSLTNAYGDEGVRTAPDGAGGALVVWSDNNSGTYKVHAQHIDSNGNRLWAWAGVSVGTGTNQTVPNVVSDNAGGAYVAWHEGPGGVRIHAQRISSAGSIATGWPATGDTLSLYAYLSGFPVWLPRVALDGTDLLVSYASPGTHPAWPRVAKVSASGVVQWDYPANSLEFLLPFALFSDQAGGAVVGCYDNYSLNSCVQRIGSDGTLLWSEPPCFQAAYAGMIASSLYPGQFWFIAYSDGQDIWLDEINSNGGIWGAPHSVCGAQDVQKYTILASDGSGGTVIGWLDNRSGTNALYGSRFTSSGVRAVGWAADGNLIASGGFNDVQDPELISLAPDGGGGATFVYLKSYNLYARHICGNASVGNEVTLCTGFGVGDPKPVLAETGSVITAWDDTRTGHHGVFAQKVLRETVPPATTTNLTWIGVSGSAVKLALTAPGDDGTTGQAYLYWVGKSGSPITDANWAGSPSAKSPSPAGATDTLTVTGFSIGVPTYIAIRAQDCALNFSGVSNNVCVIRFAHTWGDCNGGGASATRSREEGSPALALAITSVTPNPASGNGAVVTFTLANDSPATLEVLDIAGRRVEAHDVAPAAAGAHELRLGIRGALAPGYYWVRVRQGGRSATRSAIVVR